MSIDANAPLQGILLFATQLELVSSTTAAGALYGIAFALYCLYLHALLSQPRNHHRRHKWLMITCSTTIMLCALYFLVSNAWVMQDAYIKHSNFPGGPLIYEESIFHTPVMAAHLVCQSAVDILTVAIQIWRLWVVWSGTRYARVVVILPVLCLLGFTALEITVIVLNSTLTGDSSTRQEINILIAVFALRGTAVVFPTIMIAGFLIFEGRRQRKLIGKQQVSNLYMGVIAMLVESYVLESIWLMALVILYSIPHPLQDFFNDTLTYIETIAYLLVMYRVARGRTSGAQKVQGPSPRRNNISSLHWNHTTAQSGVTSMTDTDTNSSGIRSEPDAPKGQGSQV